MQSKDYGSIDLASLAAAELTHLTPGSEDWYFWQGVSYASNPRLFQPTTFLKLAKESQDRTEQEKHDLWLEREWESTQPLHESEWDGR